MLFEHWRHIEADLHQFYGIDLDDPDRRPRSWRWLKVRIIGLVAVESRIARALAPDDDSIGGAPDKRTMTWED